VAIWQNAKILWNIETHGDSAGAELSSRWSGILRWNKSTHKKQVKSDAKLVLATRMCLEEQGQFRAREAGHSNPDIAEEVMKPSMMFYSINSLELWCLTYLSEYCGARNIAHGYILPHIHKLLCPLECTVGASGASLAYPLNDQNTFSKNDSIDISKNLRVHLHKYGVDTYVGESAMHVHSHNKPIGSDSGKSQLQSSSQSFFDDDDENNIHSSNVGSNVMSSQRTHTAPHHHPQHHDEEHFVKSPTVSTPSRGGAQQRLLTKPARSNSPRRAKHKNSDASRLVETNREYLSSRVDAASHRENRDEGNHPGLRRASPEHVSANDHDLSVLSSGTVVDARSPPRRQPHPYPRYALSGRGREVEAAGRRRPQAAVLGDQRAPQGESALDYLPPPNDTKLSLNELDDSYSVDANSNTNTSANRHPPTVSTGTLQNSDADYCGNITPKYNRHSQEVSSSCKGIKKNKKSPQTELYDRNGHRIRSKSPLSKSQHLNSSTPLSSKGRRKSFSVGENMTLSRSRPPGEDSSSVAFGRRLTHSERPLPNKEDWRGTTSSLTRSAESLPDKDPEHA
jgi:hypothetical protein